MENRTHTKEERREAFQQVADCFCCDLEEIEGITLEEAFAGADCNGAIVYQGLWSPEDLDSILIL